MILGPVIKPLGDMTVAEWGNYAELCMELGLAELPQLYYERMLAVSMPRRRKRRRKR